MQTVFPNLVSTTSPTVLTPDGTLSLNYIDLISPIVAAIQELDREITSIESTVAGLAQSFTSHLLIGDNITANNELCIGNGANDPNPVCVTKVQLAALLAADNQSSGAPTSPSSSTSTTTDTPPVIAINGDNPAIVQVGATYNDLGATITGPQADLNLGIQTFVNGVEMNPVQIVTSAAATDTIDYIVTDSQGLTSTSTRTVIVYAPATPTPASDPMASTTTAGTITIDTGASMTTEATTTTTAQ